LTNTVIAVSPSAIHYPINNFVCAGILHILFSMSTDNFIGFVAQCGALPGRRHLHVGKRD